MFRLRIAGALAVVALLAAACGDNEDEVATPDESQGQAETTTTAASGSDDSSEGDGIDASDVVSTTTAVASDGRGDADAVPVDAEALLASATTALDGRSVRGEATIELAPEFELSTSFESDAEGDLAATVELPPGMDPEFPGAAESQMRYVDSVVYVRPPVTAETLAALGVDEAWYIAEPIGDPMAAAMQSAGGVMCIFPQAINEPYEDCDPLSDTGTFLEAAREPEVVGRAAVRGAEATGVRFLVSLMDLAGGALGMEPDDGASDGGAFDDTASDPFAEGLEQIFGFLEADLEVEVWIDDDYLIRRLAFDLASVFAGLAGDDAGAAMPSSPITLEFYDYDADIGVDAPPPEAIVAEGLLVGSYGGGGGGAEPYDDYDDDYG